MAQNEAIRGSHETGWSALLHAIIKGVLPSSSSGS